MVKAMDPRSGLFMVEGNHDLFEGVRPFVEGVRERGIRLLRDESSIIRFRGQPVEIMGISWSRSEETIARQIDYLADQSGLDSFPILLAHHPHAFDHAARRGIPLTLAGHTHGGQLMLTPDIGPGPMMFRYWSGLYQQQAASLVVSNGAGNWFPLRTSAPAEIASTLSLPMLC
jgi:predicted MPP superfamily phosphohydrolase